MVALPCNECERLRIEEEEALAKLGGNSPEIRSACGVYRTGWNPDARIHAGVFSTAN